MIVFLLTALLSIVLAVINCKKNKEKREEKDKNETTASVASVATTKVAGAGSSGRSLKPSIPQVKSSRISIRGDVVSVTEDLKSTERITSSSVTIDGNTSSINMAKASPGKIFFGREEKRKDEPVIKIDEARVVVQKESLLKSDLTQLVSAKEEPCIKEKSARAAPKAGSAKVGSPTSASPKSEPLQPDTPRVEERSEKRVRSAKMDAQKEISPEVEVEDVAKAQPNSAPKSAPKSEPGSEMDQKTNLTQEVTSDDL